MRKRWILMLTAVLALASCSTTRVLQEGQYRLQSNKVIISDAKGVKTSDISPYIRQTPNSEFLFGWNPLLNIYNWSDGSGSKISKFWEKIGTAPVVFNPALIPDSKENILTRLEYMGYYGSEIHTKIDTVKRRVKVSYFVQPGHQYPIEEITYKMPPGNREFSTEFDSDLKNTVIKTGDFLSEMNLETESARSAKYFNNLGYYDFNKTNYFFVVDTLGGKALLNYEIRDYNRNESPLDARPIEKYRFGNVTISRSADIKFRDNVLKRLNTIHPGSIYDEKTVNTTYNRLAALKLFNGVGVDLAPTDSNTIDCNIRLTESSVTGFKANLELSTNSAGLMGLNPKVSWYHKNIFHGAEWLTIDFSSNFQFKPKSTVKSTELSLASTISIPRFIGLPENLYLDNDIPRTEIKASFSYQDRPEYVRDIWSLSYGYSGSRNRRFFYQFYPFRTNIVEVNNLNEDFLKRIISTNPSLLEMFYDHVDMGIGGMLYYTTNSDIVPKTAYSYVRFNLDLSGNLLRLLKAQHLFGLDYSNYVRGEVNLGHAFRFGPDDRQALATRFVIGAGYGLDASHLSMPYEKMFFVGGASSMRGWQSRSLGPGFYNPSQSGAVFQIPSQAADIKIELDMEYRFPLVWKLEGALFAETGNIWELTPKYTQEIFSFGTFYKSLAADWGVGLRVNLDFILVRLDLGMKVHDPSQNEGSRWRGPDRWFKDNGCTLHFGVGYPF